MDYKGICATRTQAITNKSRTQLTLRPLTRALKRMKKLSTTFLIIITADLVSAQPAVLEVAGLFGECIPQYASVSDSLILYRAPDLNSDEIQISYGTGWVIPYVKSSGITRVLSFGEVRAIRGEALQQCDNLPQSDSFEVKSGEIVTYLYYLGEGYSKVRIGEVDCLMFVDDDEVIQFPNIQAWIKVLHEDGSSPGWLLNDGTQTKNTGTRC